MWCFTGAKRSSPTTQCHLMQGGSLQISSTEKCDEVVLLLETLVISTGVFLLEGNAQIRCTEISEPVHCLFFLSKILQKKTFTHIRNTNHPWYCNCCYCKPQLLIVTASQVSHIISLNNCVWKERRGTTQDLQAM